MASCNGFARDWPDRRAPQTCLLRITPPLALTSAEGCGAGICLIGVAGSSLSALQHHAQESGQRTPFRKHHTMAHVDGRGERLDGDAAPSELRGTGGTRGRQSRPLPKQACMPCWSGGGEGLPVVQGGNDALESVGEPRGHHPASTWPNPPTAPIRCPSRQSVPGLTGRRRFARFKEPLAGNSLDLGIEWRAAPSGATGSFTVRAR